MRSLCANVSESWDSPAVRDQAETDFAALRNMTFEAFIQTKPVTERDRWVAYLSKTTAGCPLITDPYCVETNRLWDEEGLSESMRRFGWSMKRILARYPSLLSIIRRNIDEHATLEDRQMFSIQQEGVKMQIRSQSKPNLKRDAYALVILFFLKLGKLPTHEMYVLSGPVLVKAAMLWNQRLQVYVDKASRDYSVHGGEPADAWFSILLMLTSAISELLQNTADNANDFNNVASSTRLMLLEPLIPHVEKLRSWIKIQPEVCRIGLQAHRAYLVKWTDVVHTFAVWLKDAFVGGFAAVSVRSFQDELLALRDGGTIPEIFRSSVDDTATESLIPELDSATFAGASGSSRASTGSKATVNSIAEMRRKIKVLKAKQAIRSG